MAAILEFTHNAMSKVRSGVTSGISENLTVDTKIMNLFRFSGEIITIYCSALHKWRPSCILPPFRKKQSTTHIFLKPHNHENPQFSL